MKKIFSLLVLLGVVQGIMAQSALSEQKTYLVTEGKQWAVYHNNSLCSAHHSGTITYRLQGDTILHGKTYKKNWISYKEDLSDMRPYNSFMREEDGKVYIADVYEEKLWFDYTAQVGDTLCFKEGLEYGRIHNIYDALLSDTDSTKSYRCHEMQIGKYDKSESRVEFVDQYIRVYEELGVIGLTMGYGLSEHHYSDSYGKCAFKLLCVHDSERILYQANEGCYISIDEGPRPTTKHGYGIYYGDSYLYRYIINEGEAITDSTDFARWNDKTVIYFDVDTVGTSAFTNAIFRQGQIIYFTERLNCIMPDAFTDIMILDDEQAEENPFGDLCIVFNGSAPSIDKSSISNYADTTYRITYVVPDLAAYIKDDIQWTYSQLVTTDDFVKGYISPENEVTVSDTTEADACVDNAGEMAPTGPPTIRASVRPRGDIPVRIGEGENKDIYSRAPAWQRYTVEVAVTDCHANTLYTASQECRAHGQCDFVIELPHYPDGGYVYLHSRSIDMFGRATEWAVTTINLDTSIDPIVAPNTDAPYYDLQGRPVAHPTRGIYIKNGRKVVL
ncbi:MAG: hypothetical protein E7091_06345 [Bacteroidales bacterium]|nr:hypothetical protein [Bacteroidales bacterium]